MNISEAYDRLLAQGINKTGEDVTISTGLFSEEDLIKVFTGLSELYFKIDKQGLLEIMNIILPKISQLPEKDGYNHMIDILYLLENEINNYYGRTKLDSRLSFYMKNGQRTDNENVRICSMSQIKGLGIAECVEKAALANNILSMLYSMGLFNYRVNYLNAIVTFDNETPDGHAFLEFNRTNSNGKIIHIIYDVTNPETVLFNDDEYSYPAVYILSDEEYKSFMDGKPFDNSKFAMAEYYQTKGNRIYSGFSKSPSYDEELKTL